MQDLSPLARTVTDQLIGRLDQRLPGLLEAFYVVGSIALGDYRQGHSDIDFVAVLSGPVQATKLGAIHAQLAADFPAIDCDGIYLQRNELFAPAQGRGPEARAGEVIAASTGERHAVTWLTLAEAGIALRGPEPRTGWIASSRDAAIAYSRSNLKIYWKPWLDARRALWKPAGWSLLKDDVVQWGCLGIARLHDTIATGHVASKTDAGEFAMTEFPGHVAIIREALHLRRHPDTASTYSNPLVRRRELIAFMDAVLKADLVRRS